MHTNFGRSVAGMLFAGVFTATGCAAVSEQADSSEPAVSLESAAAATEPAYDGATASRLDVDYPTAWDTAIEIPFVAEEPTVEPGPLIVVPEPEPEPEPEAESAGDADPATEVSEQSAPAIDLEVGLTLDASVLFASGTAVISPDAEEALKAIAEQAASGLGTDQRLVVEGFVDEVGTVEFNEWLGDARASAVADRLIRYQPSLEGRIDPIGHGEDELIDPTCHGDCAANRAVVITAVP